MIRSSPRVTAPETGISVPARSSTPEHQLASSAIGAGAAAGTLYASALVLATRSADLAGRARGMATVHAAGSAGHALGALSAGALGLALPGMLVIAVPGVAVIVAAVVGVWLTVPEAVNDCPVMSGLDAGASAERTPPT